MALSVGLYTGSATIGVTEYSLTNNSTSIATKTDNVAISIWIDFANMVAGDAYDIFLREKVTSGGTQRQITLASLAGAQASPFVAGVFHVGRGWDVTVQRTAGSDRSISWDIRSAG